MIESPLGGLAFADLWNIDFHCAFLFEVDRGKAEMCLCEELEAVEAAPGLALMSVIHAHYTPHNRGGPSPFDEIVCSILVHPDLSLDMPTPRLTLGVLDVWSNSQGFVEYKTKALGMPVHYHPTLRSEIAADRHSSNVANEIGPIFEMGLGTIEPRFHDETFYGQDFAKPDGDIYQGPWRWSGRLTEHQRPRESQTKLHPHSFFPSGLVGECSPRCNMQQLSEPNEIVNMRTYACKRAEL